MNDYTAPSYNALVHHTHTFLDKLGVKMEDAEVVAALSNQMIMLMLSGYLMAWYSAEETASMISLMTDRVAEFYTDVTRHNTGDLAWN